MAKSQPRSPLWRILYSRPVIWLLCLVALWGVRSLWVAYTRDRQVIGNREEVELALKKLEERKQNLERDISLLKTDRGVEEQIREKFPVVKEGEGVINIVSAEASTSNLSQTASIGFWSWLWGMFKSN